MTTYCVQVEDAEESVLQQLQALRQICIPEICFLLHSVLHASCQYKKVRWKEKRNKLIVFFFLAMQCVQISDMVISEKSKLYKVGYFNLCNTLFTFCFFFSRILHPAS